MPIETKRQTEVLEKLQDKIEHADPKIAAGRKLAIKRWAETYIEHIKSFKDDKLEFLCLIFKDEGCWVKLDKDKPDTRLNNTFLRKMIAEEKIDGMNNPLRRYDMACRYCVVDKIPSLFKEQFDTYKRSFSSNAVDGNGRSVKDDNKYILNSLLYGMKREDPVLSFWVDREFGELREYDAEEGFDSAVKLKWSEGVEYFYNLLKKDKEKKLTEAIIALSRPQSVKKDAPILDFCVRNIADKDTLLQKLLREDKKEGNYSKVYSLLAELIDSCFFDTVHDLVQCWCYKDVSAGGDCSDKIFSQREYEILLSSLSNMMLENPESNVQARSIIMEIWQCPSFSEYRKASVNGRVPIKSILAGLIVNWKREDVCKPDGEEKIEKKEILKMILFAKDPHNLSPEKFKSFEEIIIKNLRLCGREGMEDYVDYGEFAEELFSESEQLTLPTGPVGDAPQPELGAPSVSGISGRSKSEGYFI